MSSVVAQIIFEQMGGNRFAAMTGAKVVGYDSNTIAIKYPQAGTPGKKTNRVNIALMPNDTYAVKFFYVIGYREPELVSEHENVHADKLRDLFESVTGLRTSL